MAKKSLKARELKRAKLVEKYRERRNELKEFIRTSDNYDAMMDAQAKLTSLPVNSSPIRCCRRCQQCGRPRAVYRKFGLCRICLRQQLMDGNVTGGRKSSW